jgi:hypothetical protein
VNLSADDIEDLREFVDLVGELKSTRFAQLVLALKQISYVHGGGATEGEFANFDEEECRSFILGCRLLMQDNERTSIRRVWVMFNDKVMRPDWFVKINPPRWMINDYLDRDAIIRAPDGATVTSRLIVETFLYGSYAHYNRVHRQRFKDWEATGHKFAQMKLWFLVALQVVLKNAVPMAAAVEQFLVELESKK